MDIKGISERLNYAYNNNIGEGLSEELSEYIINNYNWELIAEQIKRIISRG